MIFIKLALIVTLCYIFSRGLTANYELETNMYKKRLKETQERVKEAYVLMQEEKTMLINTINELRLELNQYKDKK